MRDDERYTHDGLDLRVEQERLLALPVFHTHEHDIVPPTLKVRRPKLQPRRIGFARGGNYLNLSVGQTTNLDRFDLQEALLHEDVHIWLQQLHPFEAIGHGWRFWAVMDEAFEQAYDLASSSLPPRTNRFAGRYAGAMRRVSLVTNSDQITGDIDRALVEASLEGRIDEFLREHQLTSVTMADRDTGEVLDRYAVNPATGETFHFDEPVLELRGADWEEVREALRTHQPIRLPDGSMRTTESIDRLRLLVERDDDGDFIPFIDPNEPRDLTTQERAFLAGELDGRDYVRPAVIDLPEPFKSIPEPENIGGPARLSWPEYAPEPRQRRSNDAPRTGDRFGQPLDVMHRTVTRGWYNVDDRDRDILRALRTQGPMTARELAAYLRITDGQARHATSRLRRNGRIEKPVRGGPWVLTD